MLIVVGKPVIGPGMKVTLNFSIKLADGQLIDSTNGKTAEFTVGDGNLLPGFERAMYGLSSGEKCELAIDAESGFGALNPENVKTMSVSDFPSDVELEEGLIVSFADVNSNELPGVVQKLNGQSVTVDFNHPLAGRDLIFAVDVIDVERVSDEIIRVSE
jgi:FKBP-type peptidyl-prolyl cis-trans isomerase SlpA